LFPAVNIDSCIKADKQENAKNTDYGYYFILDQKDVIMYPGGAREEYVTGIMRITNEKGVDKYKEISFSYYNTQTLLIEKAEVVKKNNTKIEGEKNDNQVVFTNLEPGDVIVYRYRIRNYEYGRLAKDFWDRYYFNGQIFNVHSRYNLLLPAGLELYHTVTNSSMKPVISNVEDFIQYTWELKRPEPDKDESLMPALVDVSALLQFFTKKSLPTISQRFF